MSKTKISSHWRNARTVAAFLLATFDIVGCAGVNNKPVQQIESNGVHAKIVPGKSTKPDVRQAFGEAKVINFDENGFEIWIYKDQDLSAVTVNHILQYIPFVSIFNGDAEVIEEKTKTELVVLFDERGQVLKVRIYSSMT